MKRFSRQSNCSALLRDWMFRTFLLSAVLLIPCAVSAAGQDTTSAAGSSAEGARPVEPGSSGQTTADENSVAAGGESPETTGNDDTEPVVIPFRLRPYRVRIELGCSVLTGSLEMEPEQFRSDVEKAVRRMYGEMWDTEVVISDWFIPGSAFRLTRLNPEELLARYPESETDKVMLVSLEHAAGEWSVGCREYDTRVQELAPLRSQSTLDVRAISTVVAREVRDSFRPVLMLSESVQGTDVLEFLLQAGELPPPDPSAAQIADGDVLRPFLRHMERREPEKLRMLQRLDLTYVRVTEFNRELTSSGISAEDSDVSVEGAVPDDTAVYQDRGRVVGVLISHGNAPFGGRGRNVEQIALRQRPLAESSRVRLVLNSRQDRPLICHRIDRITKLRWRDESQETADRQISDRNGEIEIQVDPDHPTFWLYVYSGSLLLARVPYAPGLLESDIIKLPDDTIRLAVEGELYLFRDQLVDIVAQRAVLKGIAKKAAAAGDVKLLEQTISELDALPGKREFDSQLNAIRVPAVNRARELRNRSAERQVEKLCSAMSQSLEDFFKAEKQLKELQDIQQLRSIANQRSAAGSTAQ